MTPVRLEIAAIKPSWFPNLQYQTHMFVNLPYTFALRTDRISQLHINLMAECELPGSGDWIDL